jgi:hypothetical protein
MNTPEMQRNASSELDAIDRRRNARTARAIVLVCAGLGLIGVGWMLRDFIHHPFSPFL